MVRYAIGVALGDTMMKKHITLCAMFLLLGFTNHSNASCNDLLIKIDESSPYGFIDRSKIDCDYGDVQLFGSKKILLKGGLFSGPECNLTLKNKYQKIKLNVGQNYCAAEAGSIVVKNISDSKVGHCKTEGAFSSGREGYLLLDPQYKKFPSKVNELNIISYNVFDRPYLIANDGQDIRMRHLSELLKKINGGDIDVIIFQEAFNGEVLKGKLCELGFSYVTPTIVDTTINSSINGGVFIASKWPIKITKSKVYRNACAGFDCQAAKGVIYAKISKSNNAGTQLYHIFGTHLQADKQYSEERLKQVAQLRDFISAQQIPKSEAVIIAGDFNTDWMSEKNKVSELFNTLQATPVSISEGSISSDPTTNRLVGMDGAAANGGCCDKYLGTHNCKCCKQEFLDYVLFSNSHRKPTNQPSLRVYPIKTMSVFSARITAPVQCKLLGSDRSWEIQDVSDHYPVFVHLIY